MAFPIELLLNLSKFVRILDRIRWRLVCKAWRSFIDEFCLDELVLFIGVHPKLELWTYNSEAIEFNNLIFRNSSCCLFDQTGFKYVFRNVKNLFLCIKISVDMDYRLDFSKLKNLELRRYAEKGFYNRITDAKEIFEIRFNLDLKSLRTFHTSYLDHLRMNFPNIYFFSFGEIANRRRNYTKLNFKSPAQLDRITHLRCFRYHKWVRKLKNLQVLYIHYGILGESGPKLLRNHPKLECLHFEFCEEKKFNSLFKAKKRNRLDNLKVYLASYLPDGRSFEDLSFISMDLYRADYYKKDLSRVAPTIPFLKELDYNNKYGSFDRLDGTFYSKLVEVQVLIIAQGSSSQKELINLIEHFNKLVQISIYYCNGDDLQQFYNRLPQCCPYLRDLRIGNCKSSFLDLRFAFKLSHLYNVYFSSPSKLRHRVDYLFLKRKLDLKLKEVAKIS